MEKGFKNQNIRFFMFKEDAGEYGDIVEVEEAEFIECHHPIEYKRHIMFENGCNQICLTKCPLF